MSIGNSPAEERPSDDGPSLGETLRRARTKAGLRVEDLSASTRIRVPLVQAIENDDFSRCGGAVYARGHLRALARAVGLDPEPLLARYDAEHGGAPLPTPGAPLFEAERIRPDRRRPNWTAAMVAAIVAVVAFVGFTFVSGGDEPAGAKRHAAEGAPAGSSSPSPSATASPSESPSPANPAESAVAAVPADKVTVKLSVPERRSWVSVKDHTGRSLFDGVLEQGQHKTFTDAEQVDLVLGDAGAVRVSVNGKPITDKFRPGQVQRLSYTKGDPSEG
ncbi:helix-turn-helix domain-containing protein [Streptomyces sp. NPDC004959]|uniref:helix-turn-helix domain-containing protein n=1 Tax=unclassified Streptomyces TaxID=2593676 RepID=UPI0004C77677|nr:helix-turn-helix domain-containing protein [Streptomyces sp. NRRL F-5630]